MRRSEQFLSILVKPGLRVEDVKQLSMCDDRCLIRIADILSQHHVSNAEVRLHVFVHNDGNPNGAIGFGCLGPTL